jgi:heme exporter protein A
VTPAALWLLDEPFTALDHDNQNRLERAIAAHRAAGGRVVLATHLPIEIGSFVGIELDAFASRHSAAAV